MTAILDRLLEFRPDGVPAEVVWPAFEPELFTDEPADPELRRALGIADDEAVLVYAGNAHPSNAAEMRSLYLAVGAVNRAGRRSGSSASDATTSSFLESRAGVDRAPRRPRAAAASLRGAAVLAPRRRPRPAGPRRTRSTTTGFPSKLPEFLASGRPVVLPATNLGRFLDDGEDCVLLRRGDALEIAAAVERLLDDDELASSLGRAGRAFAERSFSWPASARKLPRFYDRVLGGPASAPLDVGRHGSGRRRSPALPRHA